MIIQIDEEKHEYIIEDLDEETLVIKETQLQSLKQRLKEVRPYFVAFPFYDQLGNDGMLMACSFG